MESYGIVKLVGGSAGKVTARGAVVRHEKRIADENSIFDLPGHVRRCVPRRVHGTDAERTHLEIMSFVE